jgi:CRP-like cAMP-binding protein
MQKAQKQALMSQSRIELLQRMPVFHGIHDATLQVLLESAQIISLPAGSHFFRQGDEALYMYVLESGRAAVCKTWGGQEVAIATINAGDCFGEVALIDLASRSATVRAETDCVAIEISAVHLYRIHDTDIEQFIAVQANIARELCRRLRLADDARMPAPGQSVDGAEQQLAWPAIYAL